ncbi:hypothetical protein conserved [Leishmania donovani]|nr:hypothetical protein conserved [Leishmania donovani]
MSSGNREGGCGGLSRSSPGNFTEHLHSSQGNRASEAGTDTIMSGGNAGNNAEERAVAFATADHGVVSLNLNDLSSALGVRRADVVSQGLMFQAHSAPSSRTNRSLQGSALQTTGENLLSSFPATGTTAAAETPLPTAEAAYSLHNVPKALPSPPWPAHYRRRHSTLRGTQLDLDPLRMPAGTIRLSPPPQSTSPSPSIIRAFPSLPCRGTPPPGRSNALRWALAGDNGAATAFAGNVPSSIRRAGAGAAMLEHEAAERRPPADDEEVSAYGDGAPLLSGIASLQECRSGAASAPRNTPASAFRTSDTATSLPLSPTDRGEGQPRQHGEHEAVTSAAPSVPSRRVHFSDDVIESIHVARQEEDYMRLLVVYNRPWYAYALLVLFSLFFGLSYASVMYLEEDQSELRDRATSVAFVLFLFVGAGAVTLTAHLLLCRQLDSEEEPSFIEDAGQRRRLPKLWSYSVLFFSASVAAIALSHFISLTVAVVMVISLACHLVAELHNRGDGGDCVTRQDALGCATAGLGAALVVLGGLWQEMATYHASLGEALLSLLGWGSSVIVSGVCWACFTRQLREMSQRVSQQFLLSTSLVMCTVALGIGTYVANVALTSDEASSAALAGVAAQTTGGAEAASALQLLDLVLLPCHRFFPDVVVLLGGGLCSLLCWYAYHAVSFYVDHASSAACMVLGAVLSAVPLIVARVLRIGWADVTASALLQGSLAVMVVGVVAVEAGSAVVVWSGFRYRREVEIRIVLEKSRFSFPRANANA